MPGRAPCAHARAAAGCGCGIQCLDVVLRYAYTHVCICPTCLRLAQDKRERLTSATALQSRALTRMRHATTAAAFSAFREHRRQRRGARRVLMHVQQRAVAAAFNGWVSYCHTLERARHLALKVLAGKLRGAFDAWWYAHPYSS